jgi:hypothetical protein
LCDYEFTNPYNKKKSSSVAENSKFVLPEDFDKSPEVLQRWDTMLLDVDVAHIMRMVLKDVPKRSFAKDEVDMADDFYSRPYCSYAKEQFGYEDE